MKKFYQMLIAIGIVTLSGHVLSAQDEGFIYGKVTTEDGVYVGPIRWGKEEVFWIDVFNASKEENDNVKYLTHAQKDAIDEKRGWHNGDFMSSSTLRWLGIISRDNRYYERDYTHQFSCQFGELKSLRPQGGKRVEVELQSGLKFDVDGDGYNDAESNLRVIDKELGEITIDWDRIERIEFSNTPSRLSQKFGEPLYGSVETSEGTFTGYVQWDHDERITSDKLDGDSEDGKVAITFDKIKSIERHLGRCQVVLMSGREVELRGSNDVNSENRGVIVTSENGNIINVPWIEFKRFNVSVAPSGSVKKYDDFKSQKEILATVTTSAGKSLVGKIIFDLDEKYDFELFQGKRGEVEYSIPLRNVKKITVKSRYSVYVELRNGEKFSLEESQDVGELNQGLLVFAVGNSEPVYIPWDEVREILLD